VQYPILPIEYKIVNAGTRTLDSIYLGFFLDPLIGHIDKSNILTQKHSAYMPDLRTAYANNVYERPVTPVGVVLLGVPRPLSSLRYTFAWTSFDDNPATDEELYSLMSSGTIKPNEPTTPGSDSQSLLAFGPFDSMEPGDTLVMIAAIISGDGVDIGPRSLKANAERALALYHAGFKLPPVPASPPLRITEGHQSVTLDWRWREGDGAKPEELWDDSNKYLVTLPPDHWRRVNPPAGSNTGGRIFEGYRLYRGESPEFDPSTFTLLRQYDVADDLGFEYDEGVEYSFTDENLVRGKRYWYSVTSFAIPTMSINEIRLQDGTYSFDTLITPGVESDFSSNATVVQPGFTPATEAGTVLVVPNPYRLDENYTFEAGGWEGRGRDWSEYKRTIWFTHLPPVAKIRVYSLTGDIVTELDHDDGAREAAGLPAGQEEWDLLSGSGRAIASGLYVFSVHSEFGTQIGKFVIIR
jgi:hypothetical protein